MAVINENWASIKKVEAQIAERTGDPNAAINADFITVSNTEMSRYIIIKYRKKKGTNFSKQYKDILIKMNYCPFTGLPLYDDITND
jgi:hypothetical protein